MSKYKAPRKFSHNCDNGDRLADMLGIGDKWLSIDDLCKAAATHIENLEVGLKYIADFPHPDFPEDDLQGEVKRAWKIICHFQAIAGYALQRNPQEGEFPGDKEAEPEG